MFQETLTHINIIQIEGEANMLGLHFAHLEESATPFLPKDRDLLPDSASDDDDDDFPITHLKAHPKTEPSKKKRRLTAKTADASGSEAR